MTNVLHLITRWLVQFVVATSRSTGKYHVVGSLLRHVSTSQHIQNKMFIGATTGFQCWFPLYADKRWDSLHEGSDHCLHLIRNTQKTEIRAH